MACLDVEIDIERGSRGGDGSKRLEELSSIPSSIPRSRYIDLQVYEAAAENDVAGFLEAITATSLRKNISLQDVLDGVSPLENTLLHVAAGCGNEENLKKIARLSPSLLTKKNYKGDTALHSAVQSGHLSAAATLIRLGKELAPHDQLLRIVNDEGNTPLHEALLNNSESLALLLIEEDPTISFDPNYEGEDKSPLYLAAESGYAECVKLMLETAPRTDNMSDITRGKSAIHAAITGRKIDVLDAILRNEPRLIDSKDEEERTPLHYAASIGYLDGVRYLLSRYSPKALERDATGFFPIHWASIKGHTDVIRELQQHCPDLRELLDYKGQNILHLAAKYGNYNVVRYIMRTPKLGKLINERDNNRNTPLHLATIHWHPRIVSLMTWDKRVNLKAINKEGRTALDAAEFYMEKVPSFQQKLTWIALTSAGATRAPSAQFFDPKQSMMHQPPGDNIYKDRINTLIVMATLVATVTFAAGFTMPGGYNNSDPGQGMATLLRDKTFQVFIFCDAISMYASTMAAIVLVWAHLGDPNLVLAALRLAIPLLGVALTTMSLAFTTGVFVAVGSLHWAAYIILIIGCAFLVVTCMLFFPLCLPFSSSFPTSRYVSYYPFRVLIFFTRSSKRVGHK